ncbi:ATPase V [Erysipelothrix inopinata]|uniref:ATP synthase F(0) sector subunit c n=1 Tax=Erysipelothrix inopinata TaxID=225084 RepID=A0A7G9RZ10_9FIRM|nr:ATPase V [Erysipelothrix inopinata]QNN60835.1 ATPase V [Erysipelothrix inopinata]
MNLNMFEILGPIALIALITVPLIPVFQKKVDPKNAKFRVWMQVSTFFASLLGIVLISGVTHADEVANAAFQGSTAQGMGFIAAAIAVSASVIGAGYAVGQAAPAAIGAISENSENFGKAMIFVALAEGVAIYGLLIAIQIIGKL